MYVADYKRVVFLLFRWFAWHLFPRILSFRLLFFLYFCFRGTEKQMVSFSTDNRIMKNNNTMQTSSSFSDQLIIDAYTAYQPSIIRFIQSKVDDHELAKDLSQDTFLRLMTYKSMIREESIKSMIYMIARNLVYDYLRRYYKKAEINACIYEDYIEGSNEVEEQLEAKELKLLERNKLSTLPTQRRIVYALNRFHEKNVTEISDVLNISKRTVETHLLLARREMRSYIRKCI